MSIWTKYTTVALVALAFSLGGCSDDSPQPQQAALRVAHLAPPPIPAVDICIDGVATIQDLAYGEASEVLPVPAGTYAVAVAAVDGCPGASPTSSEKQDGGAGGDGGSGGNGTGGVGGGTGGTGGSTGGTGGTGGGNGGGNIILGPIDVTLEAGQSITVVAYSDSASDAGIGVFTFDMSTDDLETGLGRVFVGHGADDEQLDPVDVVTLPTPAPASAEKQTGGSGGDGGTGGSGGTGGATGGTGGSGGSGGSVCTVLLEDFEFGMQAGPLDLPEGPYTLGFNNENLAETCPPVVPEDGIATPVTANVVSILVAVDEDAGVAVAPELWAIVPDAAPIALIDSGTGGTGGGTGGTGGGN